MLEAMSCECPIIATNVDGIRENFRNNFIMINLNKDELIKSIDILYNDFKKGSDLGKKSRKYIKENFDINTAVDKYYKVYQNFI